MLLVSALLIFFVWQVNHLDFFGNHHDEGEYLMIGRLMCYGYRLYSEIFAVTPPLFLESIALGFAILGLSAEAARVVIVVYAVFGILAVALIGREAGGWLAGLAAAMLLMFTPEFFQRSRIAMPDVPAASLVALSILFALQYRRTGRKHVLALSGLLASASLLCKATSMYVVPLVGLLVLSAYWPREWKHNNADVPTMLLDLSLLVGTFVLPILMVLIIYDPVAMYHETVPFHLLGRELAPVNIASNGQKIVAYLTSDWHLFLLALFGLAVVVIKRAPPPGIIAIGWLALASGEFIVQSPGLWPHHMIHLCVPLAILGGTGVGSTGQFIQGVVKRTSWGQWAQSLVSVYLIVVYLLGLPATIEVNKSRVPDPPEPGDREAMDLLAALTDPGDFVITDKEMIAFRVGRNVPPFLGGMSHKRIDLGFVTDQELIDVTQEYDVAAIMFWTPRYKRLTAYLKWVRNNYQLVKMYHRYFFFDPRALGSNVIVRDPHVEHLAEVNFDDKLMFLGYNEEVVQKKRGSFWLEKYLKGHAELLPEHRTFFRITYFWRCLEEMERDYTLATQFEGHHGKTYRIDQSHQGVNGAYPTSMWKEGEVIREEYQVEVPADYPPIRYALWVGVRDGEEGLKVASDVEADEEDRVRLGEIEVLPAEEPTPLAAEPRPQNRAEVNINDELMFLGYDLSERNPKPGDQLRVTAYWQSVKDTERDYAIQVELRNGGYKVRETLDIAPTRLWEEGRYYRGDVVIAINPHFLEGTYSLNLGLERDDGTGMQVGLASLDIPCRQRHIIRRVGKANYGGSSEIISPDEPLSLRFHLKEREALEIVAGWTGKAGREETRVEVYITNAYWREKYLGTWVVESRDYRVTKWKIGKVFTAPGKNVIELRVPELRERVHNVGWRGWVDRVFPNLLQDPRTGYDNPIQMDFAQVSTRWEGNWDDYYDLAKVYADRWMMGEVTRLYEEAVDKGVEPAQVDDLALFRGAYAALGEERKVGEIEERITGRIAHKTNVNLGGKVEFLGHSLRGEEGDDHGLSLFFRCLEEMGEDYTLWVHGEVEDESLLEGVKSERGYAVFDHLLSTSRWEEGEVYQDDEVRGLRTGRYHFTLGLWRPEDGSRLWREDDPNAHIIDLGWVEVR
jgi:hypothetical protein